MRSVTEARGTPPLRVGNDVGVDVGNDVGVQPPGQERPGAGPAGLRSLPAKQHAPKARPSPATDRDRRPPWSRAGVAAPQTSGRSSRPIGRGDIPRLWLSTGHKATGATGSLWRR